MIAGIAFAIVQITSPGAPLTVVGPYGRSEPKRSVYEPDALRRFGGSIHTDVWRHRGVSAGPSRDWSQHFTRHSACDDGPDDRVHLGHYTAVSTACYAMRCRRTPTPASMPVPSSTRLAGSGVTAVLAAPVEVLEESSTAEMSPSAASPLLESANAKAS